MKDFMIKKYLDKKIIFSSEGWINATQTAKTFDKDVRQFLRRNDFAEYLNAFEKYYELPITTYKKDGKGQVKLNVWNPHIIKVQQGSAESGGGTYLHPGLVVIFARWLSAEFAVWCDDVIKKLISGEWELKYHHLLETYESLEDKAFDLYEQIRLYLRPEDDLRAF